MRRPLIIVINGVSSVGKSSVAKALQKVAVRPFLHVRGDAFLAMLPPALLGKPEGIVFETTQDESATDSTLKIEMGPAVDRLLEGMRTAVGALALQGNDLIVDDVMLVASNQRSYQVHAKECDIVFVGLHAPVGILEQRERKRGNRLAGLALWQLSRVHTGIKYDLELDTSALSSDSCARHIAEKFDLL